MYKIRDFVPCNVLKTIYITLIQSHLSYGISVWGAANYTNLKNVIILQKRAIRLVNNSNYLDHTDPIFQSLNLLKIQDLHKVRCLKYIYSVMFLNKHSFIYNFILEQQVQHNYSTRNTNLRLPAVKKIKFKQSLIYKAIFYWNGFKDIIPYDNGIYTFLRKAKEKIISEYV